VLRQVGCGTDVPLAVVTNIKDIQDATVAYAECFPADRGFVVADDTVRAFENADEVVLDAVGALFDRYEVPVGLLPKLLQLRDYSLFLILDDSGSMGSATDLFSNGFTSSFMQQEYALAPVRQVSRWAEQEDRLHYMLEFLGAIPTGEIRITFLNRSDNLTIPSSLGVRCDMAAIHRAVADMFRNQPKGATPIHRRLQEAMQLPGRHSIYLFTDGVPTDMSVYDLKRVITMRARPEQRPITLVSCTSVDEEVSWMKEVDEEARWVAEVDDYETERAEVIAKQGKAFPYSRGLWLMCLLVGAMNPHDLDALDEKKPLTKDAFSNLLGRALTREEYALYLKRHPSRGGDCRVT
jgi:hypothetical protein